MGVVGACYRGDNGFGFNGLIGSDGFVRERLIGVGRTVGMGEGEGVQLERSAERFGLGGRIRSGWKK